jgi:hypothetical protein
MPIREFRPGCVTMHDANGHPAYSHVCTSRNDSRKGQAPVEKLFSSGPTDHSRLYRLKVVNRVSSAQENPSVTLAYALHAKMSVDVRRKGGMKAQVLRRITEKKNATMMVKLE